MNVALGRFTLVLTFLLYACGGGEKPAEPVLTPETAAEPVTETEAPVTAAEPEAEAEEPEADPWPPGVAPFIEPWQGDLDGMVERRVVRVLAVHSPVLYFVDRGREMGITREAMTAFETYLNKKLGRGHVKVHVLLMPVGRDELIPRLVAGQGDIAAAALTVTPERQALVDFSRPFVRDVAEIVVTGPGSPGLSSLDDLSGREIHVRASSSYAEHLKALSERLVAAGKAPVEMVAADELLEVGDLLEMVAAGLIPATVADSYMVDLWIEVFPTLKPHRAIPLATGGHIAWAFRKDSPQLAEAVNGFVRTYREGTLAGNVMLKKYLETAKWVKNARREEDVARFRSMVELFRKYSDEYGFDWLLMAAQGYQESGLDQSKRSPVGAVGVMQVLPTTARDPAVGIPDIHKLESNIRAGIKYDRWVADNYFDDPGVLPLDRVLLAFASYNAGPTKVAKMRREAKKQGLDPNVWFNNVELIAAKRIGRETVQYVSNIYKYYLTYQMIVRQKELQQDAKQGAAGQDATQQ